MPKNKDSANTKRGKPVDDGSSSSLRKRLAADEEQPSCSTSAPLNQKRIRPLTMNEIYTSYILHNQCTNLTNTKDITLGRFLLSLARELILPAMKLRVYNDRIPRELRLTIERVIGPTNMPEPPTPIIHQNPGPGVRKTCAVCPSRLKRRTKYFCFKCSKPLCLTCCTQVWTDCKKQ